MKPTQLELSSITADKDRILPSALCTRHPIVLINRKLYSPVADGVHVCKNVREVSLHFHEQDQLS